MDSLIYRFMDFSKFVDMVIHENITLVSPTIWDDPYEHEIFRQYIKQRSASTTSFDLGATLSAIALDNTFALSWTRLEESDALWRIYSDNNLSVRIAVNEGLLQNIDECVLKDVQYKDFMNECLQDYHFYDVCSTKRIAFQHECEVRLISHLKFPPEDDKIKEYIEAVSLLYGKNERILDDFESEEEIYEAIASADRLLNPNGEQKIKKISVTPIQEFISSVQLHPLALPWQDGMMRTFCDKFGLNYLGKSKLYEIG